MPISPRCGRRSRSRDFWPISTRDTRPRGEFCRGPCLFRAVARTIESEEFENEHSDQARRKGAWWRTLAVLIDSTHKKWAVVFVTLAVAACVVYRVVDRATPGGLTGGSFAGLWDGISGGGPMLYAGL